MEALPLALGRRGLVVIVIVVIIVVVIVARLLGHHLGALVVCGRAHRGRGKVLADIGQQAALDVLATQGRHELDLDAARATGRGEMLVRNRGAVVGHEGGVGHEGRVGLGEANRVNNHGSSPLKTVLRRRPGDAPCWPRPP